jgi:hypothetical protein
MYSFRRISNSERKFIIRKGLLSLKKLKNWVNKKSLKFKVKVVDFHNLKL